jgi:hypothetical protein
MSAGAAGEIARATFWIGERWPANGENRGTFRILYQVETKLVRSVNALRGGFAMHNRNGGVRIHSSKEELGD